MASWSRQRLTVTTRRGASERPGLVVASKSPRTATTQRIVMPAGVLLETRPHSQEGLESRRLESSRFFVSPVKDVLGSAVELEALAHVPRRRRAQIGIGGGLDRR